VTDGGIGDATTAGPQGLRELSLGATAAGRVQRDGVGAGASCTDTDVMPEAGTMATVVTATLCLVNGERADAGLPPLTMNAQLSKAAAGHSADMVERQYFAHDTPEGKTVVDRTRAASYIPSDASWIVGENLAWGTGNLGTPASIVASWMGSTGHRANILRSAYKEAGLAVSVGNPRSPDGSGGTYTMTFGAVNRASDGQAVAAAPLSKAVRKPAAKKKAKSKKAKRGRKSAKRKKSSRRSAAAKRTTRA
jgi:uncharacterized protein YkwD